MFNIYKNVQLMSRDLKSCEMPRYHQRLGNYDIIERRQGKQTVLFMDSYYLTEESRVWLRENHMNYIESIHKDRFDVLVHSLSRELHKSGTFVCAYNKSTKESCVHCWSSHERLGKKFILGNGFGRYKRRKKDNVPFVVKIVRSTW